MEDCLNCNQTVANCECHIPDEEKHAGLYNLTKALANSEMVEKVMDDKVQQYVDGVTEFERDVKDFLHHMCHQREKVPGKLKKILKRVFPLDDGWTQENHDNVLKKVMDRLSS